MAVVAVGDSPSQLRPELEVLWQAHPGPQTDFLSRREFEVGFGGAKGGGKTAALPMAPLDQIHEPSAHALILRPTQGETIEMLDRVTPIFRELGASWNERLKRFKFPSGARMTFGYCEKPHDHLRHLGREYTFLGIDQAEQFTEKQYTELISCVRNSRGLRCRVRVTFNPGGRGHHHMKRRFFDLGAYQPFIDPGTGLSRVFIPARVWDNPTLIKNDPAYIQRLLSISDPAVRKAMLEGDMNVFEGQYFSEWRAERHIVEPDQQYQVIPEDFARVAGMDYGFAPHPGHVQAFAFNPHGQAVAYKELLFSELPPELIADAIHERFSEPAEDHMLIHGDTQMWEKDKTTKRGLSIAVTINRRLHEVHKRHITIIQAHKDRINGWARVHSYLDPRRPGPTGRNEPWLRYYRENPQTGYGCPYAIETIPMQIHDPDHPGDLKKSGTDHAADSGRYGIMSFPELGIIPGLDVAPARHVAVHGFALAKILEVLQQHAGEQMEAEATADEADRIHFPRGMPLTRREQEEEDFGDVFG